MLGVVLASGNVWAAPSAESNLYMGAPVTLMEAPNGAIANKKILDGIEKVGWIKPTIEQPVEGVWVLGGYGLAPMSIIDTEEGLIIFDIVSKLKPEIFHTYLQNFPPIKTCDITNAIGSENVVNAL